MSTTVTEEPPRMRTCVACGADKIAQGVEKCPNCGSVLDPKLCVICGKLIPAKAKICSICKAYQPWWRVFSNLAAAFPVMAILALLSGVYTAATYLSDRNSNTRFKVTSANEHHIYLRVWNTGRKPSTLVAYHLHFDGKVPIKDTALQLSDEDILEARSVIAPGEPVKVSLTMSGTESLETPPILVQARNTKEEIGKRLGPQLAVLDIDVEESDDPGDGFWHWGKARRFHRRSDTFPVDRIKEFILFNVGVKVAEPGH